MPRISGIDLQTKKRGEIALTAIFGIGRARAIGILTRLEFDPNERPENWTDDQTRSIRKLIEDEYQVEGQLRTEVQLNIKRLMDIGCYRGLRHRRGLPVRGQRTHTNARTRKGPAKTVAGRKLAPKK